MTMKINTDLEQTVGVHFQDNDWRASPIKEVRRKMLERHTAISGIATSLVEYQKNSYFTEHTHTYGEEFYVLDGVFSDEHGDYAAGTYVRNPPTTNHSPRSDQGCTIFVKLWQFDMQDRKQFHLTMPEASATTKGAIKTAILHQHRYETVKYIEVQAGANLTLDASGGVEILVLSGTIAESGDVLRQGSWLRCPSQVKITSIAGNHGAKVWVKLGHLTNTKAPIN